MAARPRAPARSRHEARQSCFVPRDSACELSAPTPPPVLSSLPRRQVTMCAGQHGCSRPSTGSSASGAMPPASAAACASSHRRMRGAARAKACTPLSSESSGRSHDSHGAAGGGGGSSAP
eukprot:scaffold91735_cov60-Phaeocystis_antarctica.AAC.11